MATLVENATRITSALASIRQAIIDKGVTPEGMCETYAEAIDSIPLGKQFATGSFTLGASKEEVNCGFRPKYICVQSNGSAGHCMYNIDRAEDTIMRILDTGTKSEPSLPNTSNLSIQEITDEGFVFAGYNTLRTWWWFAIG